MTQGNVVQNDLHYDSEYGTYVGRYATRQWSGVDRPKVARVKAPWRVIRNPDGSSFRFRERSVAHSAPPKRARDVDHPYSTRFSTSVLRGGRFVRNDGSEFLAEVLSTCLPSNGALEYILDANDELKLLGKLREKLQGSDFNMSLLLGEGHQTIRMIGDTAIKIAKSAFSLRKGDLSGAARSLLEGANRRPLRPYKTMKPFRPTSDAVSSHWLELQYGWLPLLGDVKAGAEFLAHQLSVPAQQTYRMSVTKGKVYTKTVVAGLKPISGRIVKSDRLTLKVTVSEPPSMLASLGLLNPEVVAWELVPFSFVADWFLPIGSYLEARAAVNSCVISRHVYSRKRWAGGYVDASEGLPDPPYVYSTEGELIRTVHQGAPAVPLPAFKSLSQAASLGHCLSAIALLNQAVRGHGVRF
jgi:hypothetical protein